MRGRRSVVVVALLGLSCAVPAIVFAAPAAALGTCAAGLRTLTISSTFLECIDERTGAVRNTIGELEGTAPELAETGSTLGAAAGAGATASEGAGIAAADGLAAEGGSAMLIGESAGPIGAAIVLGTAEGYYFGTKISGGLCSIGVSIECKPSTPKSDPTTFTPNADVVANGASDPGWVGGDTLPLHPWGAGGADPNTLVQVTFAVTDPYSAGESYVDSRGLTAPKFAVSPIPSPWGSSNNIRTYGSLSARLDCGPPAPTTSTVVNGLGRLDVDASGNLNNYGWDCPGPHGLVGPYKLTLTNGDGQSITYLFPGNVDRPAPTVPDPVRHWQTIDTCSDGTHISATSVGFHESDSVFPEIPQPASCPAGSVLAGTEVVELTQGSSTPRTVLGPFTVPQKVVDSQTDPVCGGKKCRLDLVKIGPAGSKLGDCFSLNDACADWFTDPNKTANYKCTFGPAGTSVEVDLSECNPYAPTFDPAKQAKGEPYGDPTTGSDPSSDPTSPPASDPSPGAGGTQTGGSCFPSGWGVFNPLEWVEKPVKCALVWAFVPSQASLQSFTTTISTAFDGTPLSSWSSALGGVGGITAPGSGSCGGMTLDLPNLGPLQLAHSYDVFDTCVQPWHGISLTVYALAMILIIWFTAIGVFRIVASSFGMDVPTRGD